MAYDEFTAKMVRKVGELEQALAEKDREITHLQDVYTKQRHKQEDAYRQLMEQAMRFAALVSECWVSNLNQIAKDEYDEAQAFLKEQT